MWDVGNELGMSSDETVSAVDYLVGEGLATHRAIGGAIAMTHQGVVEVERSLSAPEAPTQYFPPVVNILHVQNMIGSQIQQGTHHSTQTQTVASSDIEAIKNLVEKLKAGLSSIPLNGDQKNEADAEIQTVEAQLKSSKPKINILRESLKTLRNLIEGLAGNALAAGLLPLFAPVAAALGF